MASTHRDEISRLELLYAAHPDGLVFPHLADAYRRAGRFEKAETILDVGLRKHSDYSSAHVVLGRLRLDQGKSREAETAFRRVLQLDPQNQVALQYLGELAAREDRTEEALGFLRRLSRLKTDESLATRVRDLEAQLAAGLDTRAEPPESTPSSEVANGMNGVGPTDPAAQPRPDPPGLAPTPPSRASGRMPEPGEVVTETMAELYSRQGLYERAAAVYRQLLGRQPGDTRLRSKLDQVQDQLHRLPGGPRHGGEERTDRASAPGASLDGAPGVAAPAPEAAPRTEEAAREAVPEPAEAPAADDTANAIAAEPAPHATERPLAEPADATADEPAIAGEPAPTERPSAEPADDSIRGALLGVVGWTPGRRSDAPAEAEAEPAPEPDRADTGPAHAVTHEPARPDAFANGTAAADHRPVEPAHGGDDGGGPTEPAPDDRTEGEEVAAGSSAATVEDQPTDSPPFDEDAWPAESESESESESEAAAPGSEPPVQDAGSDAESEAERDAASDVDAAEPPEADATSVAPGDWPEHRTPWRSRTAPEPARRTPRSEARPSPHRAVRPAQPSFPRGARSEDDSASTWYGPMAAVVGAEDREDPLEGVSPEGRALISLADLLVGLLEYRDPFFRGSSSLTRLLATKVAQEMGLSREQQVHLALAAVLRDLGRLALGGRLVAEVRIEPTAEARRKIERHVDLALQLLEGIDLPEDVRLAVRHHHERWDGGGYPDGLDGEETPLLARILAVVDSFAAMVSPRPYRLPRKVPEAATELQEESGTRYDPTVVDALLRVLVRREQPHLGFVQRHHVLIVNPDQPGALVTSTKLSSAGYLAEAAADIRTARERLRRVPVAALVVSAASGPESTTAFVRDLRLDPLFSGLPIVVTDAADVDTRVKLLENGADVCFPPGLSYGELEGTLGALVRRTIRSRVRQGPQESSDEEAPWLALQGDIQDFPLTWLLQVMKYDSRTAAIGIRAADDEGAIYLKNGDAVHAEIRNGSRGEGALRRMLQWRKGRFTVQPDARPEEQTINTSIMHLLLTQAVAEDHAAAGVFGAVSAES